MRSEMGEAVMMFPPTACTTTHSLHNHTQLQQRVKQKLREGGEIEWQRDRETH